MTEYISSPEERNVLSPLFVEDEIMNLSHSLLCWVLSQHYSTGLNYLQLRDLRMCFVKETFTLTLPTYHSDLHPTNTAIVWHSMIRNKAI